MRLRKPLGLKVSPYFSIVGVGDELAVLGEDALHGLERPGPKPGHTGWPLTIVFSTITYESTGTSGPYTLNSPSMRRFVPGSDPSTTQRVRRVADELARTLPNVSASCAWPSM